MDKFVVSARKYRPANFNSVVGQGHITSTLVNAIARGQLAHAYLFCGPRGVGKTTCARIFAKAINCLSPVDNEPCDNCESCRGFNESRSFNIHETDAASNNSVDDIRTLTEQVRIPPQIGRYSVYIIDEVHMLSSQAFNAFLKTLEEPPAHAIFILATTEKHKIIPTILSRCQIFDFNRIKVEDGVSYLKYIAQKEGVTADDESLNLIASKADGGMRDALSMFDKAVSFCGSTLDYKSVAAAMNVLDYDAYFSIAELLYGGDYQKALLAFDEILSKGFSQGVFLTGLNSHFRDLLMAKSEQTLPLLDVAGSLLERYKKQGAALDAGFLFNSIALLTSIDATLKTASCSRLNVELGLMKICRLGQKKNNDTLETTFELPELVSGQTKAAPEPKPEPQPEIEKPKPKAKVAEPKTVSVSGMSINTILNSKPKAQDDEGEQAEQSIKIDAQSEAKINENKDKFIAELSRQRPRLGVAFGDMTAQGNKVKITVPSDALQQEIQRTQTEVLGMLQELAGINGMLELEIEVVEKLEGFAPIKVDDKLKFLVEKNPLLNKLRKAIELDFE